MPTSKQRRVAARRHVERQVQRRRSRTARQKKVTLIASAGGAVVLIAAIVVAIVLLGGGSPSRSTPNAAAAASGGPAAPGGSARGGSATPTGAGSGVTARPSNLPPMPIPAATGPSVTFDGVTVTGAKDISGQPTVTSKGGPPPTKLEYKDLVVGTGKPATPMSTVSVQEIGEVYGTGKVFTNSYATVTPVSTSLAAGSQIPGLSRGIGGGSGIPAMQVGGRRLLIVPAKLGYGTAPLAGSGIPDNASLVYLIDLKQVT